MDIVSVEFVKKMLINLLDKNWSNDNELLSYTRALLSQMLNYDDNQDADNSSKTILEIKTKKNDISSKSLVFVVM
ncbi:hypothetical protein HCN44_000573 [Aphidius gifuensis]|uniref:Uncharacterized protein n=1 Tax=Aphidius gifuensis TaxID=684658 RepID=A0A835CR10_APHGI|nr:hypothetical protein HCN44_000573 [Aphidius gifuensis]